MTGKTGEKGRVLQVVAGAFGALLVAASVAAAHTAHISSSTTFRFIDREGEQPGYPDLDDDYFAGRISSSKPACERGRVVRVFRRAPGADELVTATSSADDGRWSQLHEDPISGTHYARVLRKEIGPAGHEHVCRPAVSQDRLVDNQP